MVRGAGERVIKEARPAASPGTMKTRLLSTDSLQNVCVLCVVVWAISPPLAYDETFRVLVLAAAVVWAVVEISKRPGTFIRPSLPTGCALFFIIYSVVIAMQFEGPSELAKNLQIYIFLLFLIFYESYRKRDLRQLRYIFWISLVLFPVWFVATLNAYVELPNISRIMSRSSDIAEDYSRRGVGGYGLVYSAVVAVPILVSLLKERLFKERAGSSIPRKLLLMTLLVSNLILSTVLVLRAGYSIALILAIGGIIIAMIIGKKSSLTPMRLSAILLVVLILFSFGSGTFTGWVMRVSEGTLYTVKVEDMMRSVEKAENLGGVADRTERYSRSIRIFLENPILGTLEVGGNGGHSAILDRFASYGIFVGVIFLYTLLYLPIRYLRRGSNNSYGVALSVAFVVVGVTCFNTVVASFGYMIFVFYPVAMTYFESSRGPKKVPQGSRQSARSGSTGHRVPRIA